uniref:Uncharacterized protein n=1 Tax=Chromera velia CCMP2878 TaxID=1169474 RepID=A0A0G4HL40_9ALVE|eukprot:Cvel_28639.t1-p1 / transcript=Cvel_28639.t1 / gene=Cvel_28639 / organism=Chromera_velia_CCMP2878 / gene_product=hypothetical protein / transcript_product=hypothetical protein / location=Cvel_scaffold3786:71-1006(+) / protein_length=312 / sequence_SO=supercontig / SO=protein_coding / is_pseudo=false
MIRTRSPSPLQAPRPLGSRPVPPIAVPPLRTHSPLSGMSPLSAISQQRDRDAASASASAGSKKRLGQGRSAATSPLLPPSRHPNPPMRTLALFPGPPTSAAYSTSLQTHSATRTPVLLSPAVLSPRDYPGHPFSRVPLPHATKPSNAAPFQPVLRPPLPVPSASHFSPPSRADAAHFAGAPSRFTFAPGAPTPNVAHPPHATTPPAKPSDARPGTGPSMRPQPALFTFPKAAGLPPPTGQPYGFGSSHFIHSRPTYVPPLQRAPNTGLPPPGPSTRPPAWAPTASVGSREAGQGGGFWCGSGGDCAGRRGSQ